MSQSEEFAAGVSATVAERCEMAARLCQAHRFAEALPLIDEALMLSSPLAQGWLLKSRCLSGLGDDRASRQALDRALSLNADDDAAWLQLAESYRLVGDLAQAAVAYQKAIELNPASHMALMGKARLLLQQGSYDEARQVWHAAMAAAGTSDATKLDQRSMTLTMGQDLMAMGRLSDALSCFDLSLRMIPNEMTEVRSEILVDAADCVLRQGQRERGEQLLAQASMSTVLETLLRLAVVSNRYGFSGKGLEALQRATNLYPASRTAWSKLATMQAACWQMDDALASASQVASLGGDDALPEIKALVARRLGDVNTAMTIYGELVQREPMPGEYAARMALCSLYSDLLNPLEQIGLRQSLLARLGEGARSRASFMRAPLEGRRIRLGVLAAGFHSHSSINWLMQPVLRLIDRSRFEVTVYYTGVIQDEQTILARTRSEHWLDAALLSDEQLAARIDNDQVDVLLDLTGLGPHNRMTMLAQRAAPVQMAYLGFPGYSGLPNMDYVIGDAVVSPVTEAETVALGTEVARLPGTVYCYAPEDNYAMPDYAVKMAGRPLTFTSFHDAEKLTDQTLALWAQVMHAVPESRLLLKSRSFDDVQAIEFFRGKLAVLGVSAMRLEFRGSSPVAEMMASYADADIALDPTPCGGGLSTLQAMWMGVPVITLQGDSFAGRLGSSFMQAAGLDDWVAPSAEAYVAIAQRVAANRPMLLALKSTMRTRLKHAPAWDAAAYTNHLSAAIEHALVSQML